MILISNFLLQVLLTLGITVAFGLAIWGLNKIFYKLAGSKGRAVCIATGFIGTPVHEIGHAFFCLPFGHKIKEIKLFQPNSADGVLGYVKHTYNKKNIYHLIGNFFISFGPIIFGSGVLLLLMFLLVPDLFNGLTGTAKMFEKVNFTMSFSTVKEIFRILWEMIKTFFDLSLMSDPLWWVFIIPACSIALHMSLSPADVKNSLIGIGVIPAVWLVVDIILYFANIDWLWAFTEGCIRASGFLLNFYTVSILMSLMLIVIGFIIKCFIKIKR